MRRFIVVGLGNFGSGVAETLHARGMEVAAVDTDDRLVDRIAPMVTHAAVGDGRDIRVLERIGARDADGGVISTGDDITSSILAALALKDLGVRSIYVKVISRDHARVMEKLGVSETIFPERESAIRLGTRVSSRAVIDYVRLGEGFSIQEMAVPDSWTGHSLRELRLPRQYGVSVVALHDVLMDVIVSVPDPDAPLKESDTLLVAGRDDDLERLAQIP